MNCKTERARYLRKCMTPAEELLWGLLRGKQFMMLKFRRQAPVGPYIVDFTCPAIGVAIEVDGGAHFGRTQQDAAKDLHLRNMGYTVLRVTNQEVLSHPDSVLAKLQRLVTEVTTRTPRAR